mmetsp:Transcript_13000/g.9404  ORF Transcript_13000/g.9404 Transcript_13000/m.9404 type:complete len:86 (-) Transcript_13000:38-295(-)|eukprot:CAMPEP_0202964576 /NCGR_PEP_ID=MMETSP1396-20130829/8654_1 /ASSEMBLY_ACC=CAM_ASM_000872 /TAXON_ID= /ORGANISM="Pseudokeronopsis sp., Strain Brazil" /LENGTH=85 /DNA_ID=CAMNT_0049686777 /DNA_START=632 /DNA_END=889 /DNA_ORIENTATION=-
MAELMLFYENFHLFKYPKDPILMLRKKFFIVQYEADLIHAVDGLGSGIVIVPQNSNFLMKVYGKGESYAYLVKVLQELAAVFQKN